MNEEIMSLEEILQDPYYKEQFDEKLKNMTDGSLNTASTDIKMGGKKMNNEPNTQNAGITQPQAEPKTVNVDINAILKQAEDKANEVAEKKADAVMKSILKEKGLDDNTISEIVADYKSKQVTPEQENQTLKIELEKERQEKTALKKGIPLETEDEVEKEKVNACLTLAKSYVNDETDFETALDKALKVISFEKPQTPPIPYSGGGNSQVNNLNKEDYKTYEQKMELKGKNPKLYEELFPSLNKKK